MITITGGAPGARSAVLEHASANDAHLHRFEEAGDDLVFGQRRRGIVGPLRRPAVHGDAVVGLTMDEEVAHGAGGDHARQRPNPADRVVVVRGDLGGVVVRARQIDLEQQDVLGREPAIGRLDAEEAARQQSGA